MPAIPKVYVAKAGVSSDNVLDNYVNTAYLLSFSMLPMSFFYDGIIPVGTNNGKKIIIAQQGVTTKFNMEDLAINQVLSSTGSTQSSARTIETLFNFKITEPLGSSFINLLHMAYKKFETDLDKDAKDIYVRRDPQTGNATNPKGPLDMPYLIEVKIIGTKDDVDTTGTFVNESGEAEVIGNWAWPVWMRMFDIAPETEGTRYNVQCVSMNDFQLRTPIEVNQTIAEGEISGENLKEYFENFVTWHNTQIASASTPTSKEKPHKINIKWGKIYTFNEEPKAFPGVPDDPATEENEGEAHLKFDIVNLEVPSNTDAPETATQEINDESGNQDFVPNPDQLYGNIGNAKKIKTVIEAALGKCSWYAGMTTMYKWDFETGQALLNDDGTKQKKDPTELQFQLEIRKVSRAIKDGNSYTFAPGAGGPTMETTYVIDLKQQNGMIFEAADLAQQLTEDQLKQRIESFNIYKEYNYMYTGLNDQVQEVDISFQQGQVFLFPQDAGLTQTYKNIKSAARDVEQIQQLVERNESADENQASSGSTAAALAQAQRLATDLKLIKSDLTTKIIEQAEGLASAASPQILSTSDKLPSSPSAIFAKGKAIARATEEFDKIFNTLGELEEKLENTFGDAYGTLQSQISEIIASASTPFNYVSEGFGKIASGIDGFMGTVNDATGLSLSANDIPGIGSAKQFFDQFTSGGAGESTSSGGGGGTQSPFADAGTAGFPDFETLTYTSQADTVETVFMEELDYYEGDPYETQLLPGGAVLPPSLESTAATQSEHFLIAALKYREEGIPYLARLDMVIKGDPFWLGENNVPETAGVISVFDGEGIMVPQGGRYQGLSEDGEALYVRHHNGTPHFAFKYVIPREPDTWQDDPNDRTGLIDFAAIDGTFSGYYMATSLETTFSGGFMTHKISGVKAVTPPNELLFETEPEDDDEVDE
jgi:hypothetical protein